MRLFKDLLDAADFEEAVLDLSRDFMAEHGLPQARQLGLVVPDAEVAAAELETEGIGPFFIASGPARWWEGGEETTFHGKIGLAFYHDIELELLEPGTGSDFYKNSLDQKGRPVVQHVGFQVSDVAKWLGELSSHGYAEMARGKFKAGPLSVEFGYLDTTAQTGFITEVLSPWRFGSLDFALPRPLVHLVGAFQKVTGFRSF